MLTKPDFHLLPPRPRTMRATATLDRRMSARRWYWNSHHHSHWMDDVGCCDSSSSVMSGRRRHPNSPAGAGYYTVMATHSTAGRYQDRRIAASLMPGRRTPASRGPRPIYLMARTRSSVRRTENSKRKQRKRCDAVAAKLKYSSAFPV